MKLFLISFVSSVFIGSASWAQSENIQLRCEATAKTETKSGTLEFIISNPSRTPQKNVKQQEDVVIFQFEDINKFSSQEKPTHIFMKHLVQFSFDPNHPVLDVAVQPHVSALNLTTGDSYIHFDLLVGLGGDGRHSISDRIKKRHNSRSSDWHPYEWMNRFRFLTLRSGDVLPIHIQGEKITAELSCTIHAE